MKRRIAIGARLGVGLLSCLLGTTATEAAAQQAKRPVNKEGRFAPLFDDLGTLHLEVTTDSKDAQQYFDQGLRWFYAFNHAEAVRSFEQAAALDPKCAMAYWGQALALGPSINHPMTKEAAPKAYAALRKARELARKPGAVTESERAFIEALTPRYSSNPDADRGKLDRAYAGAMRKLAREVPRDPDAGTLFAAALMNLRPWDYWTPDGHPYEGTEELVAELERVIELHPNHPGALHYYIHAVEASSHPETAIGAADRLGDLMPGAGHLVHMPSHIYIRVGQYADSSNANLAAVEADKGYLEQCRRQGLVALVYHPHNIHFLSVTSMFEGAAEQALESAREVAAKVPADKLDMPEMGHLHAFEVMPLEMMVRFGHWREILDYPKAPTDHPFLTAIRHFARGMALVRTGKNEQAARELDRLRTDAKDPRLAEYRIFGLNSHQEVANIAAEVLAGELAAGRGDLGHAISHLQRATLFEDALKYNEPPDWPLPPRHYLGAALLRAKRPIEAESVYWDDLRRSPENGWALFGLVQSLKAQGKDAQAAALQARFEKAWSGADVKLTASRF